MLKHFTSQSIDVLKSVRVCNSNKYNRLLNTEFAFDIETSTAYKIDGKWQPFDYSKSENFYTENNIQAITWCYIWQFGFMVGEDYYTVYGRTLEEFAKYIDSILETLNCDIICYIHNAGFEFEFLRNVFTDMQVFARKRHKPLYFTHFCGGHKIEFRCSYMLTNQSLENVGKQNKTYKKMSGDLNYNVLRFSDTTMTEKELKYCENDILVILEYIRTIKKNYNGRIDRIPLTQTGKMRKEMRKKLKNANSYKRKSSLLVPTFAEYMFISIAFMGGYTHLNPLYYGKIVDNVRSMDLVSAYIYCICCCKFPTSHFTKWNINKLEDIPSNMLWVAEITFYNIKSVKWFSYIPAHKCKYRKKVLADNGKVERAEQLTIIVTNLDYALIKEGYKWEKMDIESCACATSDYLDDEFRLAVLDFFCNKESLKKYSKEGTADYDEFKADLFMRSKEYLNATYGACVTNYVTDEIMFINNKWDVDLLTPEKVNKILNEQRNKEQMFRYSTGLFIPAYNRLHLVSMLYKIDRDAIYSDTDSIKFKGNYDNLFTEYNKQIEENIKACCTEKVKFDMFKPNGRLLGTFDEEVPYKRFVSYGSKKYAYEFENDNKVHITVAGLNKEKGAKALNKLEDFKIGKKWDYEQSGRLTSYYVENQPTVEIDGHIINYRYGVYLRPCTYTLGITDEYENFIALANANRDYERSGTEYATSKWKKEI